MAEVVLVVAVLGTVSDFNGGFGSLYAFLILVGC